MKRSSVKFPTNIVYRYISGQVNEDAVLESLSIMIYNYFREALKFDSVQLLNINDQEDFVMECYTRYLMALRDSSITKNNYRYHHYSIINSVVLLLNKNVEEERKIIESLSGEVNCVGTEYHPEIKMFLKWFVSELFGLYIGNDFSYDNSLSLSKNVERYFSYLDSLEKRKNVGINLSNGNFGSNRSHLCIKEEELYVLYLRYWKEMSLESIGNKLGITGSRIRQIEQNGFFKIRRWLISVLPVEEREWLWNSVGSDKFSVIEEVF